MLLTVGELARQLSVSQATAYRWIASGAIPSVKIAGCRRVARADLEAFVDRNRR